MARGFSLVEVLVALALTVTAVCALVALIGLTTRANGTARITTAATLLAAEKLEELRAFAWTVDAAGQPLSDANLAPSPAGALSDNTPGYCDFTDAMGRSLAGSTSPPPEAMFVRRWSIAPLAPDPVNTMVLQVTVARVRRTSAGTVQAAPDDARLASVKTRKAA